MTTTPGEMAREIVPTKEDLAEAERILLDLHNRGRMAGLWRIAALVQDRRLRTEDHATIAGLEKEIEWLADEVASTEQRRANAATAYLDVADHRHRLEAALLDRARERDEARATIAARDATIAGLREALTAAANLYAPCRPSHGPAYCSRCGGILDLEHDADRTHRHPCDACAARTLRELLTTPTPPVASEET